jgi:hypothetical protein
VAAAAWLLAASSAYAQAILAGTARDLSTGSVIAGASITVTYGGVELGTGLSQPDGTYRIPLALPSAAPDPMTATVTISQANYAANSLTIQIAHGAVPDPVELLLMTQAVSSCKDSSIAHAVVVGHFRLPVNEHANPELPAAVAESLNFDLRTKLQQHNIGNAFQPSFIACDEANPRAVSQGKNLARALNADAFVSGATKQTQQNYHIDAYVSDGFQLFTQPQAASSDNVDLNSPLGASMNPETQVAILAAVADSYIREKNCRMAIDIVAAAEQLAQPLPAFLAALRAKCPSLNAGLVP